MEEFLEFPQFLPVVLDLLRGLRVPFMVVLEAWVDVTKLDGGVGKHSEPVHIVHFAPPADTKWPDQLVLIANSSPTGAEGTSFPDMTSWASRLVFCLHH